MVFSERHLVRGTKRGREFQCFVGLSVLQGLAGEQEATEQPHQALSGSSVLLPLFVLYQLFECAREILIGIISFADFLFRETRRIRVSGGSWDIIGSDPDNSLEYFP